MSSRNKRSYLIARAREEAELAAAATSLQAKIAHLQLAAEYQERAGDFAAQRSTAESDGK
jgi:hypothetical protein